MGLKLPDVRQVEEGGPSDLAESVVCKQLPPLPVWFKLPVEEHEVVVVDGITM